MKDALSIQKHRHKNDTWFNVREFIRNSKETPSFQKPCKAHKSSVVNTKHRIEFVSSLTPSFRELSASIVFHWVFHFSNETQKKLKAPWTFGEAFVGHDTNAIRCFAFVFSDKNLTNNWSLQKIKLSFRIWLFRRFEDMGRF